MGAVTNGHAKEDHAAGWEMAWEINAQGTAEVTKAQAWKFNQGVLPHVTETMFDEAWAKIDTDHSGTMSKQEFIAFAEKYHDEFGIKPTQYLGNVPMQMEEKKEEK